MNINPSDIYTDFTIKLLIIDMIDLFECLRLLELKIIYS